MSYGVPICKFGCVSIFTVLDLALYIISLSLSLCGESAVLALCLHCVLRLNHRYSTLLNVLDGGERSTSDEESYRLHDGYNTIGTVKTSTLPTKSNFLRGLKKKFLEFHHP